jgi:hypothetical protein
VLNVIPTTVFSWEANAPGVNSDVVHPQAGLIDERDMAASLWFVTTNSHVIRASLGAQPKSKTSGSATRPAFATVTAAKMVPIITGLIRFPLNIVPSFVFGFFEGAAFMPPLFGEERISLSLAGAMNRAPAEFYPF